MQKYRVLVAGATGYLGRFITQELVNRGIDTTIIVRNKNKITIKSPNLKIIEAQVTQPSTLKGICNNVDVVISSIGITRQKDGLTYMDVDYQANANLIDEAKKSNVKRFIYISVLMASCFMVRQKRSIQILSLHLPLPSILIRI